MANNDIPHSKEASVWKLQAIETARHTLLHGTILQGLPKLIERDERSLSNFSKMVRSYFSRPLANAPIEITFNDESRLIHTDKKGNFRLETAAHPESPIRIRMPAYEHPLPVLQGYPIHFRLSEAPYLLVSDIDDTVLVSHTQSFLSRLRVLLFDAPADREAVEATRQAFEWLNTPQVQFMYLSRSEINLFHLITQFLQHHDIPAGPLLLRDYTRWHALFGDRDAQYKYQRLAWIARSFPDKRLLLFGDDSQQDLEVFHHIVRQFPGRVEAIFIRQTRRGGSAIQEARLQATGVPTMHYREFSDIQPFLQTEIHEITAGG